MVNPVLEESVMLIEVAIKKLVKADLAAASRLGKLQGKVLCVELTSPLMTFYVAPVVDGLEFGFDEQNADCTITGSWVDFLSVAEDEQRLFSSNIKLDGDYHWVVELKSILMSLDVDWEGLLAKNIGGLAAHQLAQCFRSTGVYVEHTSTLLRRDISDYLHEELRILPSRPELKQFYSWVDAERLAVDRLQARIQRLEQKAKAAIDLSD